MKKIAGGVLTILLVAALGHAASFRHTRPFEGSNFVKGTTVGIRTDMVFDRSHGRILIDRKVIPIDTHFDGKWSVFLGALDSSPLSKKAQMEIVARGPGGDLIERLKANATRDKRSNQGFVDDGNSLDALDFQFPTSNFDIPAGGSLETFFRARRQATGPGRFYYQQSLTDDDGDSDSDSGR